MVNIKQDGFHKDSKDNVVARQPNFLRYLQMEYVSGGIKLSVCAICGCSCISIRF